MKYAVCIESMNVYIYQNLNCTRNAYKFSIEIALKQVEIILGFNVREFSCKNFKIKTLKLDACWESIINQVRSLKI